MADDPPRGLFAAGEIDAPQRPLSRPPAIPEPTSFLEGFEAMRRDQTETRNSGVREFETLEELWRRHRAIEAATGRRLPLSESLASTPSADRDSLRRFMDRVLPVDRINSWILGSEGRVLSDDAYEEEVERLRSQDPDAMSSVETRAALQERLQTRWLGVRERAESAAARSGMEGTVGGFAGSVVGVFQDPPNAGMALLTGGAGAGRPLLSRMLAQGGISAGVEAMDAPERARDATTYGGPSYTAQEGVSDILLAGAGGAGFEVLGEVVGRGVRGARGFADGMRQAHQDANLAAAQRRWAASGRPPRQGWADLDAQSAPDFSSRALSDLPAVEENPALRRATARLEALERDEVLAGNGATFEMALDSLDRFSLRPRVAPERPDLDVTITLSPTGVSEGRSLTYHGRPIWAESLDPLTIDAEPSVFQFRSGTAAEGVSERLRGVQQWDATAAGRALVWERRDGRLVIADGHQRRGLARRLVESGADPDARLEAYVFREAEGWSAGEVRVVAAMKNIREGSGSILDAARVLREAPELIEDRTLPVTGDFMAGARGLARLDAEAFGAVAAGAVPERYAAVLGELAAHRPDLHMALLRLIREADPRSIDEARALTQEGLLADELGRSTKQEDLFGAETDLSAVIARGRLRAAVLKQLRSDARLFGSLVRHADAIETGGNVLARSGNEARLALDMSALAMVDRLAMRSGTIGDAFGDVAARVADGSISLRAGAGEVLKALKATADEGDLAAAIRAETIAPRRPAEVTRERLRPFDEPGGSGQVAQARPKPEDAAREAEPTWDDLPEVGDERRALDVLRACAPGGGG